VHALVRGQSGQALPLVLVVMIVLFALAGAITLGTSELLRQQGGSRTASTDDLAVQSATADAIAQVAGSSPPKQCTVASASTARFNPPPTPQSPLPIAFPNVITSVRSTAYCSRLDHVAAGPLTYLTKAWPQAGNCLDQQVTGGQRAWIVLDGRWKSGGYAYVDGNSEHNPCISTPAPVTGRTNPCTTTPKGDDCVRCGQTIGPSQQLRVVQVALDCDVSGNGSNGSSGNGNGSSGNGNGNGSGNGSGSGSGKLYLHLYNVVPSPPRTFFVPQDRNGGTMYLVAADTKFGPPRDYEESVFYVPPGGGADQLLYEAPLP
jgi:hypothetical protein